MISTTNNQLFIIELTPPYGSLEIQFYPSEIQESRKINNQDLGVIGYNNSGSHYTGGDDLVSFKLTFYAFAEDRPQVLKKVRWLESLGQANGTVGGQPEVSLVFGQLFKNRRYVLKSCEAKMLNFDAENGQLPAYAEVQLSFKRLVAKKTTFNDTRNSI